MDFLEKGVIAVHYEDEGWDGKYVSKRAKSVVERFRKLGEEGGWVISDYSAGSDQPDKIDTEDYILIGKVVPKSHEEIRNGCRCDRIDEHRRDTRGHFEPFHLYKTLRLDSPTRLSPDDYGILTIPFSRSAFATADIRPESVECMYKKESLDDSVDSLGPGQLEVLCEEYLRAGVGEAEGLPRLKYLLAPIGGQLKDLDIMGKDTSGKQIFAQVCGGKDPNKDEKKLKKLSIYENRGRTLLYFRRNQPQEIDDAVTFVNVGNVYSRAKSHPSLKEMIDDFLSPSS